VNWNSVVVFFAVKYLILKWQIFVFFQKKKLGAKFEAKNYFHSCSSRERERENEKQKMKKGTDAATDTEVISFFFIFLYLSLLNICTFSSLSSLSKTGT
jgi:hypothetical protein